MKINVVDPYKIAAEDCAYFVFESEWVQDGYTAHIENGDDPRDHILYSAAVILGKIENFQDDIKEYLSSLNQLGDDQN